MTKSYTNQSSSPTITYNVIQGMSPVGSFMQKHARSALKMRS
jgi:hypothetical protein